LALAVRSSPFWISSIPSTSTWKLHQVESRRSFIIPAIVLTVPSIFFGTSHQSLLTHCACLCLYYFCFILQRLRSMVHEIVGRINGRYGTLTENPIHHLDRQLSFHEVRKA